MIPRFLLFISLLASYFVYDMGLFSLLLVLDRSYLSFVIIFLFFFGLTYAAMSPRGPNTKDTLEKVANLSVSFGLLGTIVGFVFMLTGFTTMKITSADDMRRLLDMAIVGMSTSLYTTLFGISSSIVLGLVADPIRFGRKK